VSYVFEMLQQGFRLLGHDPLLHERIVATIRLALESTLVAALIGLPLGIVLGLGRSRFARGGILLANAGLGLPPVAVGVYAVLILGPYHTPWGGRWVDSLNGMVLCQAVIALPIIVAFTAAAVQEMQGGLVDQARALGASRLRLMGLASREARVGVATAIIVALFSAIGEVGAINVINLNGEGPNTTLASQMLFDFDQRYGIAGDVEHGLVLLAMAAILGCVLLLVRNWGWRARRRDARARVAAGVAT
jgi:tungstate transport system permease protein